MSNFSPDKFKLKWTRNAIQYNDPGAPSRIWVINLLRKILEIGPHSSCTLLSAEGRTTTDDLGSKHRILGNYQSSSAEADEL